MKNPIRLPLLIGSFFLISVSCTEEDNPAISCGCDSQTIKYYENVVGTVMRFDTFYIELQESDGTIGVGPCEGLDDEFKIEGLKVVVSGELKQICPLGTPNTKVTVPHPAKLTNIKIKASESL